MEVFRHQYQQARAFQKAKLKYILPITVFLFVLSITVFALFLSMNPGAATRLLLHSSNQINSNINTAGLLPTILENLFTGFYLIAFGLVPLVFLPLFFVLFNGSIIGILLGSTTISNITVGMLIAYLLPHGILLIPATLLAASYGIYLCKTILMHLLNRKKIESFYGLLLELGRAYVFIIAPLMIVSAFLEVFVTPLLVSIF